MSLITKKYLDIGMQSINESDVNSLFPPPAESNIFFNVVKKEHNSQIQQLTHVMSSIQNNESRGS